MFIPDEGAEIAPGELLARARAGDAASFCRLVEPLQARLYRQAAALSGDLSAADDLVSETLVQAWKSLPRYDASCRLSTWIYAILLHRHQKWRRQARSRPVSLSSLPVLQRDDLSVRHENLATSEPSPAESAAQSEFFAALREGVERLPEKHRDIIRLRFFEDASLLDMAQVLDCSLGTVKSRLHHALEKLRQMKMNLPPPKGDTPI